MILVSDTTTTTESGESRGKGAVMAQLICTTCGGSAEAPHREYRGGEVVWGCVSAAHDAHADAWHLRPEAAKIRQGETWGVLAPA
jgi:hypothetical protein